MLSEDQPGDGMARTRGWAGVPAALLLALLLVGCAGTDSGQPVDVTPRFDGVYQSREITNMLSYLRFFPDGTLVFASVPLTDITPFGNMETWLVPGADHAAQSAWRTQGDILVFTLNLNNSVIPCEAELEGDRMWVSMAVNFDPQEAMFEFKPF